MNFTQTSIPDVIVIEAKSFEDERGAFFESFNEQAFISALTEFGLPLPKPFVQDNHSSSRKCVLRGLHYQAAPFAQGKLVRVVKGAAFDVAVDIRQDSPHFGKWVGLELTESNKKMLWIPEGFAHGFVAIEDDTHFLYKTTAYYNREAESSIVWNDFDLNIKWPVDRVGELIISDKDTLAASFKSQCSV